MQKQGGLCIKKNSKQDFVSALGLLTKAKADRVRRQSRDIVIDCDKIELENNVPKTPTTPRTPKSLMSQLSRDSSASKDNTCGGWRRLSFSEIDSAKDSDEESNSGKSDTSSISDWEKPGKRTSTLLAIDLFSPLGKRVKKISQPK